LVGLKEGADLEGGDKPREDRERDFELVEAGWEEEDDRARAITMAGGGSVVTVFQSVDVLQVTRQGISDTKAV
jgi:hypothetical protein